LNSNYTYLLAEDEPLLARKLAESLSKHWPDARCVAITANGAEALNRWRTHRPAVLFLDIRMPVHDGLEVARRLCNETDPPLVVFVTAYDSYVIQAFDASAIDYLLKPVEDERLINCIERIRQRLSTPDPTAANQLTQCIGALLERQSSSVKYLSIVRAGLGHTAKRIPTTLSNASAIRKNPL